MRAILLFLFLLTLTACQQEPQNNLPIKPQTEKKYSQETDLTGVISNKSGRIKSGQIHALNTKQQIIASADINEHGQYHIVIPANTVLPIELKFQQADETLLVVVIDPVLTKYDINTLTTDIAKKAKEMGGYTRSNLTIAAENSVHVPDANKTTTGFRGDPTTQYGGWH